MCPPDAMTAPGKADRAPTISVVIPVHAPDDAFRHCLAALAAADPPPLEVVVVADGVGVACGVDAADGMDGVVHGAERIVEMIETAGLRARGMRTRVIDHPARSGPAAARNAGAAVAEGAILFFVDADVAVRADTIGRVGDWFAGDGAPDALIGSYDDAPAAPNFLSQYRNLLHHHVHQTARAEAGTFWGACGAIRRELFHTAGGFDPRFTEPSIEDIAFGRKLRAAGRRIRLDKALQVTHHKRWTARALLVTDIRRRAWPWARLILAEGRVPDDLNLRWSSRASSLLVVTALPLLAALPLYPRLAVVLGGLSGLLIALNAPLYAFFTRHRGPAFALGAIAWHWLYYLYSGLTFAVAVAASGLERAAAASRHAKTRREVRRRQPFGEAGFPLRPKGRRCDALPRECE